MTRRRAAERIIDDLLGCVSPDPHHRDLRRTLAWMREHGPGTYQAIKEIHKGTGSEIERALKELERPRGAKEARHETPLLVLLRPRLG